MVISCLTADVHEDKTQANTISREVLNFLNIKLTIYGLISCFN